MQAENPGEISWPNFNYPIHHAEHAKLNTKQRQAIQHYAEMVKRLVKKRDQYQEFVDKIPRTGLGVELHPDDDAQDELFDLTQSYFEHTYSTLGSLASVHGRIRVFREDPPIKGVEKFVDWWSSQPNFWNQEESVKVLRQARDFRTILAHPQQGAVFDWGTVAIAELRTVMVVLHGEASSKGNVPSGASKDEANSNRWWFQAPNMDCILAAFLTLTSMTFHMMPAKFPLKPEEETCTWEADGFGSAPAIALEQQIAEAVARDHSATQLLGKEFKPTSW